MNRNLVVLSLAVLSTASYGNLISNGGFEANTVYPGPTLGGDPADGWAIESITPDVWDNGGVDGIAPGTFGYFPHVTAYEGTNWASLAGFSGVSEAMSATPVALSAGQYTFSAALIYDEHNPLGYVNPAGVDVYLKQGAGAYALAGILAANTGPDQWELRSLNIQITTSDTYTFMLAIRAVDPAYVGIDDVQFNPVPEPATMAALGLGAAALIRRRRK